ncbi:hypothetical protein EJ06DRAFT_91277 [Trichodelitschia bisporula]|uniref:Pheromone-regulated membrane protein n=1 Tax=Trichodelitschia bisporula TaxID=703511 RepID=A0A6G1HRU0_9PEZI|nr:hypothetical protein EJ06DRAFT_91277 [Trichodelitschia bisporula]
MGRWGGEERESVLETQKWDYITIKDFKAKSCGPFASYVWLIILVIVTIAVYAADTFTAVKLLAFNEWSSEVKPGIPFAVSKWIFAVCILLSWTLALFEWFRAIRVMRRGSVTEDYLDPLAVVLRSLPWKYGGWRRFLVFTELTKSKKKVTWIALFVYFERKGAVRLLAADGPRQCVNAVTLWSVAKATLVPVGTHAASAGRSPFLQFFENLRILGASNRNQIIILSSMAFTLIIWVLSILVLLTALILYIIFLWHHIQNETLTGFCRRKVETRLARIVKTKMEGVWAKRAAKHAQQLAAQSRDGKGEKRIVSTSTTLSNNPTLPSLGTSPPSATSTFSPPFEPKRAPTLPTFDLDDKPTLSRAGTGASTLTTASNAPLLSNAAQPAYTDPTPPPGLPRAYTSQSQRGFTPGPPRRVGTGLSSATTAVRTEDYFAYAPDSRKGTPYDTRNGTPFDQSRNGTPFGYQADPQSRHGTPHGYAPAPSRTPAQTPQAYEMGNVAPRQREYAERPGYGAAAGAGSYSAQRGYARRDYTAPAGYADPMGREMTPAPRPIQMRSATMPMPRVQEQGWDVERQAGWAPQGQGQQQQSPQRGGPGQWQSQSQSQNQGSTGQWQPRGRNQGGQW